MEIIDTEKMIEKRCIEEIEEFIRNNYSEYNKDKNMSLFLFLVSLPSNFLAFSKGAMTIFLLNSLLSAYFFHDFAEKNSKLKELKKYKMYLSMREDLKKEENANILDLIEFEKIYQIPLTLENVPKYSLYDLKILKKGMEKNKLNRNEKNENLF